MKYANIGSGKKRGQNAGNDQQVDPDLQLAGDAPVVHRGTRGQSCLQPETLPGFLCRISVRGSGQGCAKRDDGQDE